MHPLPSMTTPGRHVQGAMEFFWQAKQSHEAFAIAEQHQLLEAYLRLAGSDASPEDLARAVAALEARGDWDRAAELYKHSGNAAAAAALYLKVGTLPCSPSATPGRFPPFDLCLLSSAVSFCRTLTSLFEQLSCQSVPAERRCEPTARARLP